MRKRLKEYRTTLREALLGWLWGQWTTLGLPGASSVEERRMIDPEALLLFTGTLGRWDPRLFDEVLDWLVVNGRFINGARLKRMLRAYEFRSGRVLAAVSSILSRSDRHLDWRFEPAAPTPEEFLFFGKDGGPLPAYGKQDPWFAGLGFRRGRFELRGHCASFNPSRPPCLWLTLRSLVGISSRVEILVYLLCNEQGYPSRIARDTGHSQRSVQDSMVDMAASGQLHVVRKGREVQYRLASILWRKIFFGALDAPEWLLWPPIFRAIEIVHLDLHGETLFTLSEQGMISELFMLMERVRPLIELAGLSHLLSPRRSGLGDDYFSTFRRDLSNVLLHLGVTGKLRP